ncbi:MAG: hypothetical protein R3F49_15350 [Planctomycetota bacterium]
MTRSTPTDPSTPAAPEARARRSPWPFLIVGLLTAHVCAMILAVRIANDGRGADLLPEYQQRNAATTGDSSVTEGAPGRDAGARD